MPPTAPTRFGGADGPSFGESPGDEDVAVAFYVAEPSVAQGVGRYSGGQIQGAPQLHYLCRRTEAGRARVLLPSPSPAARQALRSSSGTNRSFEACRASSSGSRYPPCASNPSVSSPR